MNRVFRLFYYLCFLILVNLGNPVFAQLRLPTLNPTNRAVFQNSLNIYDWNYHFGWGASPGKLDFVSHYLLSSTMQYRRGNQLWKDQQSADLIIQKKALQNRTFITRFDFNSLKDEFSSFNYDRIQSGMTLASRFPVKGEIILQPEIGFRMENRSELAESGPYYAALFTAPNQKYMNLNHNIDAWGERSNFKNRNNSQVRINYSISNQLTEGTRDSLSLYYDYLRRDNFLGDPGNDLVESLNRRRIGLTNYLHYGVGNNAGFRMRTDIGITGVEIDNNRIKRRISTRGHDDFNLDNNIHMYWRGEKYEHQLAVEFGEMTIEYNISDSASALSFPQRFVGVGYDIVEKYTRFSQKSQYRFNATDSIRFYFGLSKLEYDNTDQTRSDNHDEQQWMVAFFHAHRFNEIFTLQWELSTYLRHFVYLGSQLSGQNNWTRILKFQPECIIRLSPRTEFRQKTGIRTNYVVSDFTAENSALNNYVIRDYFIADSLALGISEKVSCVVQYKYEAEELGSLNWKKFSSRPRTAWRNQWGSIKFRQHFANRLNLSMGAVFYEQKRWNYELNADNQLRKEHVGTHTNLGPIAEFMFINKRGSTILFSGKRQKAFPFLGKAYYINNLELIVQWKF
ncbi:MAG: hypothetical protein DWQ05_01395 [Calditrichaeota bacterium]|nr:MAG: hypothetical protein DWQ05_01395 [Calditrichota bacterium]